MEEIISKSNLRFSEFQSDKYQRFGFEEIFNFSIGKNIKQNEASPHFRTPCVRYGELYHLYSEVITEVVNRTNIDDSELLFSDGDEILLPSAGEDPLDIGSASALTVKGVAIGRTINILKPKSDSLYSQVFTSYYINKRLRKKISTLAKGVSISNVYNSDLRTLEIVLPSLPEQQKIASFLTSVDTRIEQLQKKKSLLEQYKKGVMQKIFSQEIRFNINDESNNTLGQSNWKIVNLGSLIQSISSGKSKPNSKGSFPVYGSTGRIGTTNEYTHCGNYLLVARVGANAGKLNLVSDKFGVTDNALVIELGPELNIKYLESFLIYFNLNKLVFGSGQPLITGKQIKSLSVPKPSLEEQTQIANFVSAIDHKIEQVSAQLEKTQTFKKGLLQQMFV